jgi:DNA polymerase-3 subunit alpha
VIFDLMAEFANYGFNKSHSAAYGLITYQTAYLKVHFPEEFMAAIMTCDLDNTSKIVRYVDEVRRMRMTLLPPDINRSILSFDVPPPSAMADKAADADGGPPKGGRVIGFGLAAIKGIGAPSLEPLVAERERGGPYKSLADMARRVNLHKAVGKKTLELLAQAGALDGFGMSRPKLLEVIGGVVKFSEAFHTAQSSGQRGLFDEEPDSGTGPAAEDLEWELSIVDRRRGAPDPEWLKKEKALLGVFLTGHPLAFHKEDVKSFGRSTVSDLHKMVGKKGVPLVAVLAAANERLTKTNTRMASFRLEDENGAIEAVMFEKELPPELPPPGILVVAVGNVDMSFDKTTVRFRLEKIEPLEELRLEHVRGATLHVVPTGGRKARPADVQIALAKLKQLVDGHGGDTPLKMVIGYDDCEVAIRLDGARVDLKDAFLHGLNVLPFDKTSISFQLFSRASAAAAAASGPPPGPPHAPPFDEPIPFEGP